MKKVAETEQGNRNFCFNDVLSNTCLLLKLCKTKSLAKNWKDQSQSGDYKNQFHPLSLPCFLFLM